MRFITGQPSLPARRPVHKEIRLDEPVRIAFHGGKDHTRLAVMAAQRPRLPGDGRKGQTARRVGDSLPELDIDSEHAALVDRDIHIEEGWIVAGGVEIRPAQPAQEHGFDWRAGLVGCGSRLARCRFWGLRVRVLTGCLPMAAAVLAMAAPGP